MAMQENFRSKEYEHPKIPFLVIGLGGLGISIVSWARYLLPIIGIVLLFICLSPNSHSLNSASPSLSFNIGVVLAAEASAKKPNQCLDLPSGVTYNPDNNILTISKEAYGKPLNVYNLYPNGQKEPTALATIILQSPTHSFHGYTTATELTSGGQGIIYTAFPEGADQTNSNNQVAIKTLNIPTLSDQSANLAEYNEKLGIEYDYLEKVYQEALKREAQQPGISKRVPKPIAKHIDPANPQNSYIVMEYISNQTLTGFIRPNSFDADVIDKLDQLASILQVIHDLGLVHLDLKPENIGLRPDGTLALPDFGSVRAAGSKIEGTKVSVSPTYASPEQLSNQSVNAQSDVYSLGLILYEMITGDAVIAVDTTNLDDNAAALAKANAARNFDTANLPEIPGKPQTTAAIKAMLNRDPNQRPTLQTIIDTIAVARSSDWLALAPTQPNVVTTQAQADFEKIQNAVASIPVQVNQQAAIAVQQSLLNQFKRQNQSYDAQVLADLQKQIDQKSQAISRLVAEANQKNQNQTQTTRTDQEILSEIQQTIDNIDLVKAWLEEAYQIKPSDIKLFFEIKLSSIIGINSSDISTQLQQTLTREITNLVYDFGNYSKALDSRDLTTDILRQNNQLPETFDDYVIVAHFPQNETSRKNILENGLWSVVGRDTLLLYESPDYREMQKRRNQKPILFRVPKSYIGTADQTISGANQVIDGENKGLAIYNEASASDNPELFDQMQKLTIIISGTNTKPLLSAIEVNRQPSYLPKNTIISEQQANQISPSLLTRLGRGLATIGRGTGWVITRPAAWLIDGVQNAYSWATTTTPVTYTSAELKAEILAGRIQGWKWNDTTNEPEPDDQCQEPTSTETQTSPRQSHGASNSLDAVQKQLEQNNIEGVTLELLPDGTIQADLSQAKLKTTGQKLNMCSEVK